MAVGRAVETDAEQTLELGHLRAELAIELVAADPGQVVALRVEKGVLEVGARRLGRRRLARAGPLVDLQEGVLSGRGEVALFLPLSLEKVEIADETVDETVVVRIAQGSQQDEKAQPALAGHPRTGRDLLAGLGLHVELDPLPAVGVDGAGNDRLQVAAGLEDDAGGADQLRDHYALGSVDDEGALVRHHREVPHEDGLLFDLAGVGVLELRPHEDGGGKGHVLLFALLHRELRRRPQILIGGIELQDQLQGS